MDFSARYDAVFAEEVRHSLAENGMSSGFSCSGSGGTDALGSWRTYDPPLLGPHGIAGSLHSGIKAAAALTMCLLPLFEQRI
jgi:hypothetical protein